MVRNTEQFKGRGFVMAEICLDCWNKINGTNDSPKKYILSEDLDLCEECGEWKNVIVITRRAYYFRKFRFILFPVKVITAILLLPFALMTLLIRKIHDICKKHR